jgi:hypothetical protein
MIRDLLGWLDYSLCAQIALAIFVAVFVGVGLWLWLAPPATMARHAALPLADGKEDYRAQA